MKNAINQIIFVISIAGLNAMPAKASKFVDNIYLGASANAISYELGNNAQKQVDSLNEGRLGDYALADSNVGYNLFLGYQFTEMFSLELGYRQLGEVGKTGDLSYQFLFEFEHVPGVEIVDVFGTSNELAKVSTVEVLAKMTLPLTEELKMYGKAGFVRYQGDIVTETDLVFRINRIEYTEDFFESETEENNGTDKTFVLGLSYDFLYVEVFAEYQKFRFEHDSANSFNVGAVYSF